MVQVITGPCAEDGCRERPAIRYAQCFRHRPAPHVRDSCRCQRSKPARYRECLTCLEMVDGIVLTHEHFWDIESPNGPTSEGTCRHCGERRTFVNHVGGSSWERRSVAEKEKGLA